MDGDTPAERFIRIFLGISVGTIYTVILLGLLSSPALIAAVQRSPTAGSYAVVGIVGFSLYFAVTDMFAENEDQLPELGILARTATMLLTIAYFNMIVSVAVGFGIAVGPSWGVAVATLYPIVDARIVDFGLPVTVSGVAVILLALIVKLSTITPSLSWRDLRPPRPRLAETIGRVQRR